jgi:hypothetical protein
MSLRGRLRCAALAASLLAGLPAAAQVPALVPYQGVVLAPDGSPRSELIDLELRIFAAPSGGTELFVERHADVPLVDGVFSIQIGSQTALDPALFSGGAARWLELWVDGERLGPRHQFLSVPYSFEAGNATLLQGLSVTQVQEAPGPISGFQQVSAGGTFSAVVLASCPAGKAAVGGGCDCAASTLESRPVGGSNSWRCECSTPVPANRAWAVCADAGAVCGNGAVDAGEECDSAATQGCTGSVGAGTCTENCTCICGNGTCDDGVELAATCPADCRPAYSHCTADSQCEGAMFCLNGALSSFCTASCVAATCNLDPSFSETCNSGGPQTTYCSADCKPPPPPRHHLDLPQRPHVLESPHGRLLLQGFSASGSVARPRSSTSRSG